MKLVIIGGGSSYTPELIEGVILHKETLPVTEVVLIDVDMGLEKVRINTEFAKRMVKKAGLPIDISYTLDRREGLKDAAFVITQLRVGGLDARAKDENPADLWGDRSGNHRPRRFLQGSSYHSGAAGYLQGYGGGMSGCMAD